MSILQLRFNKATLPNGYIALDKGNTTPAWFTSNLDASTRVKSNWYKDTTPSPNTPDIFVNNRQSDLTTMFQYGQDVPAYATAKFFNWRYQITNEKVATNGTVTATVTIHVGPTYSRHAQPQGSGLPVIESMTVGGTQVFSFTGRTIDEFGKASTPATVTKNVTIPAQSVASGLDVVFKVHYTDNSHPDVNLTLGTQLYNPSIATYRPMLLMDGGRWQLLNDYKNPGKYIKFYSGGAWLNTGDDQLNKQDALNSGSKHTYYSPQGWRQMPLPEGGTDD